MKPFEPVRMKKIYLIIACIWLALGVSAQVESQETPFFPGEMLVRVTDNSKVDQIVNDLRQIEGVNTGVDVIKLLSGHMRIWHFRFDDGVVNAFDMKRAFATHPAVEAAQFNHEVQQRSTIPDDPEFDQQWHHVNANGSDIDSDLAWDITTGGTTAFGDEIVVCVIEGGNLNHPDLVDNKWVNEQEIPGNGIDDDGNGYIDDYNGWNVATETDAGVFNGNHGTQVFGMIGAKGNNGLGVAGVNWDVKMMSVAGENLGSEASVVSAYNYPLTMRLLYNQTGGESGAFVVATNASWGIDNANAENYPIWCGVYDDLGEAGILNCGATANNNVNIDVVSDMPTGCSSPYMVAVTATNNNDVRTFSGYGVNTIDLAAPGASVRTTSGNNGYGNATGTSFASPLTAGAIALIYSTPCPSFAALIHADPQAGADFVFQVLMDGVDPVANLENEVISGGRLNVHNSIQLVLQSCSDSDCFAPFAVNIQGDVIEGYTINWGGIASMQSFNLRYREVGAEDWIQIDDLEEMSFELPELEWCTEYEAQVMANCEEESSIWGPVQTWLTSGCCEYPSSELYTISDVTEGLAMISWASVLAADTYSVTLISENGDSQSFDNIINTSFMFSGLEPCTMYDVFVGVNCITEEVLEPEFAGSFITFGCGPCADMSFCESFGGTEDEWIQRVQLESLDHNSGDDGGYGNFTMNTDLTTALDPGGTYSMTITPGYAGSAFSEIYRIWIDFNSDGEFGDDESIFASETGSNEPVTATFNIPSTTEPGSYRMRVTMKYAGFFGNASPPTPCEEMEYGEVEDYCIEITDDVINVTENARAQWQVYPNPSNGRLFFDLPEGVHSIEVLDLTGRMVAQKPTTGNTEMSLGHLSSGVYLVHLVTEGKVHSTQRVVIER